MPAGYDAFTYDAIIMFGASAIILSAAMLAARATVK
jgi:hypothetical protein